MEQTPLCDICGQVKETKQECGYMSCPKLWDEARIDRIGQNGNEGLAYVELFQKSNEV